MSTVSEKKLVTFLRKLQNGDLDGNPLAYIQKIYDDRPRQDVGRTSFPRVQVKELGSSATWTGIGDTARLYDVTLLVTVFVDMDSPIAEADVSAFWTEGRNMSPEEACGAICYHISKELGENKATLHSDNDHHFILRGDAGYTDFGIDNAYFENLNVYKGGMSFNFILRD